MKGALYRLFYFVVFAVVSEYFFPRHYTRKVFFQGATMNNLLLLRQLVTSLSLQRARVDPMPVHMGFVVDKVALGQVLQFPCDYDFITGPYSFLLLILHNLSNGWCL
jgi:hypothetical protein